MLDDGIETETSRAQDELEEVIAERYERLAEELDEGDLSSLHLRRHRHARFVGKGLGVLGSAFSSLLASRPWIVYWCVHSLALLGAPLPAKPGRESVVALLLACQGPEGGFGCSPGAPAHLAPTYASLAALTELGAVHRVDRRALARFLLASARDPALGGGFRLCREGEVDVRGAYVALAAARLARLDCRALARRADLATHIRACRTHEGGYGGEPGNEAHGGNAYCAVAAAALAAGRGAPAWAGPGPEGAGEGEGGRDADGGAAERDASGSSSPSSPSSSPRMSLSAWRDASAALRAASACRALELLGGRAGAEATLEWIARLQLPLEGGFAGRTSKLADACYSFWQGGGARILEGVLREAQQVGSSTLGEQGWDLETPGGRQEERAAGEGKWEGEGNGGGNGGGDGGGDGGGRWEGAGAGEPGKPSSRGAFPSRRRSGLPPGAGPSEPAPGARANPFLAPPSSSASGRSARTGAPSSGEGALDASGGGGGILLMPEAGGWHGRGEESDEGSDEDLFSKTVPSSRSGGQSSEGGSLQDSGAEPGSAGTGDDPDARRAASGSNDAGHRAPPLARRSCSSFSVPSAARLRRLVRSQGALPPRATSPGRGDDGEAGAGGRGDGSEAGAGGREAGDGGAGAGGLDDPPPSPARTSGPRGFPAPLPTLPPAVEAAASELAVRALARNARGARALPPRPSTCALAAEVEREVARAVGRAEAASAAAQRAVEAYEAALAKLPSEDREDSSDGSWEEDEEREAIETRWHEEQEADDRELRREADGQAEGGREARGAGAELPVGAAGTESEVRAAQAEDAEEEREAEEDLEDAEVPARDFGTSRETGRTSVTSAPSQEAGRTSVTSAPSQEAGRTSETSAPSREAGLASAISAPSSPPPPSGLTLPRPLAPRRRPSPASSASSSPSRAVFEAQRALEDAEDAEDVARAGAARALAWRGRARVLASALAERAEEELGEEQGGEGGGVALRRAFGSAASSRSPTPPLFLSTRERPERSGASEDDAFVVSRAPSSVSRRSGERAVPCGALGALGSRAQAGARPSASAPPPRSSASAASLAARPGAAALTMGSSPASAGLSLDVAPLRGSLPPPLPAWNPSALQVWLLACCQLENGFGGLRDKPGKSPDYYHTCYGLSGLALAQGYGSIVGGNLSALAETDVLLNVTTSAADAARDALWKLDAEGEPWQGEEKELWLHPAEL